MLQTQITTITAFDIIHWVNCPIEERIRILLSGVFYNDKILRLFACNCIELAANICESKLEKNIKESIIKDIQQIRQAETSQQLKAVEENYWRYQLDANPYSVRSLLRRAVRDTAREYIVGTVKQVFDNCTFAITEGRTNEDTLLDWYEWELSQLLQHAEKLYTQK